MSEEAAQIDACPSSTAEAGLAPQCAGCPGAELCASGGGGAPPPDRATQVRLGAIGHVIYVLAGKGGVGKSTVAASLASGLARRGRRVGVLDVDVCGPSAWRLFGIPSKYVFYFIWNLNVEF